MKRTTFGLFLSLLLAAPLAAQNGADPAAAKPGRALRCGLLICRPR